MKRILTLLAIVCMASVLTGCCCCGPCGYTYPSCGYNGCGGCGSCPSTAATSSDLFSGCGSCGSCCEPCGSCSPCGSCNACEPCGCSYGPACPPNYCGGCCFTNNYPCCPIMAIIALPFRIVENIWMCAAGHWPSCGCGPTYWGEWSDPPCCDPCCFNNYAGPCSSRCCGATACNGGCCDSCCDSCGYDSCGSSCGCDGGYEANGGEVIMDSAAPAPTTTPNNSSIIQPTPAPAPAQNTTTSNCRNCNKNRQTQPTTYKAAKANNGNIQQIQYQQPVQNRPVQQQAQTRPVQQPVQARPVQQPVAQTRPVQKPVQQTYAAPKAQQNGHNIPEDILKQLPPGAVIVSDEVVSSQGTVNAGGDAYAPVLTANQTANQMTTNKIVADQTVVHNASQSSSGWKSAAVNKTQR